VYSYRFDWDDGGRLLAMDFHQLFGAAHRFEALHNRGCSRGGKPPVSSRHLAM
jgi:hypothetical protein